MFKSILLSIATLLSASLGISAEINFNQLDSCLGIPDAKIKAYLGMTKAEFEDLSNYDEQGLSKLPEATLEGPVEYLTVYEDIQRIDASGSTRTHREQFQLPRVNGIVIYPQIRANGYNNFLPFTLLDIKEVLPVDLTQIQAGTRVKVTGRKTFLYSEMQDFTKCRVYGEALHVQSLTIGGVTYSLTDRLPPALPKTTPSENPDDLFVLLGSTDPTLWFDPINFFMDRTVRVRITDNLEKRKVLTKWSAAPRGQKAQIAFYAKARRGNSWDPNWHFNIDEIEFVPSGTQLQEICDGNFGQLESSYRSYRHARISELDSFCPWTGAELVEIQDASAKPLKDSEIKGRLKKLGGPVRKFMDAGS